MTTPNAEAIKTLKEIRGFEQSWLKLIPDDKNHTKRIAALTLAIDAMTAVEWLEKQGDGHGLHIRKDCCWILNDSGHMVCEAPTLSELATKLKDTQTERHAMTANVKLAERLEALRFDPRHHIGAGDIRLTLAQQDEIIASLRSPSPAQGTVLPEAITNELIIKSQFGLMIRGFNGMGFDARLGDVLTDVQLTPQAALDALAKQLDAGGKP